MAPARGPDSLLHVTERACTRPRRARAALATAIAAGATLALASTAAALPVIGGPNGWTNTPVYPVTQSPVNPLFTNYTWQVNAGPVQAAQPFGAAPPIPGNLGDGQFTLRAYEGGLPARVAAKVISIDRTPPAVSLAFVPGAATVQFGAAKTVSYSCVGAPAPVPAASCNATIGNAAYPNGGTLPTNSLGTKTVKLTATDLAGNTATTSKAYTVVDTIAPTAPTLVSPLDPTGDATPTFQWIAASDQGGSGIKNYQLKVLNAAGATVVNTTINHPSVSHTSSALPNGNYTWIVTAVDKGNNTKASATGSFLIDSGQPEPPTISNGPGAATGASISNDSPTFTIGGEGPGFAWTIEDEDGDAVDAGILTSPGNVTADDLDDGAYSFRAVQVSITGNASSEAVYVFTVDTVAPKAVNLWGRPVSPGTRPNPVFSWTGPEPDINYSWSVSKDGKVVQGPVTTAGGQANLKPLVAGTYQFSVTSKDLAANTGPAVKVPFVIEGAPAPAPKIAVKTTGTKQKSLVIRTRNVGKLGPKVGRTLTTRNPTLTWKKTTKDTVLYNLQVFAVKGNKLVKVYSTFPKGTRFRVPNRRLGFGQTYVWQVFAYRGPAKGYLAKPIGISWFKTKKKVTSRLLIPKAPKATAGKALGIKWKVASKARYYRVDLYRGSKRVWAKRTTGRKAVIPSAKLKTKGTYKLIIRRGTAGTKNGKTYAKGAWVGQKLKVS